MREYAEKSPLLGVLGGMGPEATEVFYRHLIRRTRAGSDQEHLRVLIYGDSTIPDRTAAILSGDTAEVEARLAQDAQTLERAGCTLLAMTCNTAHHFAPAIERAVGIPLLHMPELAVRRAKEKGVRCAALLSTQGAITAGVYQTICRREGLDFQTPDAETQQWLTEIIYGQIKAGGHGDARLFARVDEKIRAAGCDGAILGCTELSVYRAFHAPDDFYIDAMDVLAEACIRACGGTLRDDGEVTA